jgi:hypothetical protein
MSPDELARSVVLTIKGALAPLAERIAAVESFMKTLDGVRDRVVVLETKAAAPTLPADISELRGKLAEIDRLVSSGSETMRKLLDDLHGTFQQTNHEVMELRVKMAGIEARAPVAGPAGAPGRDGVNGADGLGFDDIVFEHDGERTITAKGVRGDRMKALGTFVVPVDIYRGVFIEGKTYERGDGVTWGGSEWHCHETTTSKPGEGSKAWTLKVKRGRDGKDGKDAPGALPVVSLGGRS